MNPMSYVYLSTLMKAVVGNYIQHFRCQSLYKLYVFHPDNNKRCQRA